MRGIDRGGAERDVTTAGMASFGDLLRRHWLAAGLTQEALAERAGLSVRATTDLERRARRAPYRDTVRMLAEALALGEGDRAALDESARRPRAPAARIAEPWRPADLPTPLTTLLGREREVTEAARLLRRTDVRLLTLTGSGGIGKTRVGLQAAAETRDDFADGAVFVALAPLTGPALVLPTIAQALRLTETAGASWLDGVTDALREKHLLLVLDNFEHVLVAASDVAVLLQRCPRLTALVTSRAPLRLSGERVLPVPPLALPERGHRSPPESLRQHAAVELFCQRAEATTPSFTLTVTTGPAVAEIVRRLDGLPLAIELAAARSKVLPPVALLERLRDRLSLLTGGPRDLPARQQTLRDSIAWSFDLLSRGEQMLFRRLAVFSGGFSLDAVTAVCGAEKDGEESILDGISALVNAGLLRSDAMGDGEPRFGMLETVREYAWEQLRSSGEVDAFRQRHAVHMCALVEAAVRRLPTAEAPAVLVQLDTERDNIRVAFQWAIDGDYPDIGLRLLSLVGYWVRRGQIREGRRWAEAMLALPGLGPRARALVLGVLGNLAGRQHDAAAIDYLREAVAIFREIGIRPGLANALRILAQHSLTGDLAAARAASEESVEIDRTLANPWGMALALDVLGSVMRRQGEFAESRPITEESMALYRQTGDEVAMDSPLRGLAQIAEHEGDLDGARLLYEESLTLCRAQGESDNTAVALTRLASLLLRQGDNRQAAALLEEGIEMSYRLGLHGHVATCLSWLATVAYRRGEPRRAAHLFGTAEAIWEGLQIPRAGPPRTYRETVEAVRGQLGEADFAVAWAEGHAMELDAAVALAVPGIPGPGSADGRNG